MPPALGFHDKRYYSEDTLKQQLGYLGIVLNLKDDSYRKEHIPVSKFIKVHNLIYEREEEEKNYEDERFKQWIERHYEDLMYESEDKICYVLNTSEIFPYDVDLAAITPNRDRVLRHELISMYDR